MYQFTRPAESSFEGKWSGLIVEENKCLQKVILHFRDFGDEK